MKRNAFTSMSITIISLTMSSVTLMVAIRAGAQNADHSSAACYIQVEGLNTQDLTPLCGQKPTDSPKINRGSSPTSGSQSLDCDPDDEDSDCQPPTQIPGRSSSQPSSAPLFPIQRPVSPTGNQGSAGNAAPPTSSTGQSLVNRPGGDRPGANRLGTRSPRGKSQAKPAAPNPQALITEPSTARTSSFSTRPASPFLPPSTVGAPSTLPPPPTTAIAPAPATQSVPPLPQTATSQAANPQPSMIGTLFGSKNLVFFCLIFLQIPLLKVITDKFVQSKSRDQKTGMTRSPWQKLKQRRIFSGLASEAPAQERGKVMSKVSQTRSMHSNAESGVMHSVWQQLKQQKISCEQALELLVDSHGMVNLELLDRELSNRFLRNLPDRIQSLPILPLLLWRNCFYLGSPLTLSESDIQILSDSLKTLVQIIPIHEKSYRQWKQVQMLVESPHLKGSTVVDPLTGKPAQEDITEVAEYHLAQTDNQIERIQALIASALRNRASDIHLAPAPDGLRVRFRIDGILRPVTTLPIDISRRVIVSLKVMCNMDISESRRPQDGRIGDQYATQDQGEGLDLRVSTVPCVGGIKGEAAEKAVLRLLRQKNSFSTIDDLGFSPKSCEIYKGWLKEPQGVIILTGPTGSGKTSTLYTSLQAVATDSINIITVEDPVEYVLPGITQIQVHETAGMTFAAGLRAILRQDPDIIMLGEIRDSETAETAIRAALTGHLVLTTLHTNDAIGAIPRLKDMEVDPGLISDALLGVVAQRLVRKVCPHCAEPYTPTQSDLEMLGINLKDASPQSWRKGKGCQRCFSTGYLGREAIIELLNVDHSMRQIIHDGNMGQLHSYLDENEFDSFRSAAIAKVVTGTTTIDEIRRVLPYSVLRRR